MTDGEDVLAVVGTAVGEREAKTGVVLGVLVVTTMVGVREGAALGAKGPQAGTVALQTC